jgi:hypothetical protein
VTTTAPVVKLSSGHAVQGTVWFLHVRCPYCGKTHTHGGGTSRMRVASYLGPRVSHCVSTEDRATYTLTDPDGLLS